MTKGDVIVDVMYEFFGKPPSVCVCVCVCVRACARACARVRACVRACVCVRAHVWMFACVGAWMLRHVRSAMCCNVSTYVDLLLIKLYRHLWTVIIITKISADSQLLADVNHTVTPIWNPNHLDSKSRFPRCHPSRRRLRVT